MKPIFGPPNSFFCSSCCKRPKASAYVGTRRGGNGVMRHICTACQAKMVNAKDARKVAA